MRYSEIRIDELYRPKSVDDASLHLLVGGYSPLGKGAYGEVWYKEGSSYVLKLFTTEDTAYVDFLKLAKQHQDNPSFPKFFGKLIRINDSVYAVRMEKLTKYKYDPTLIYKYMRYRDDNYVRNEADATSLVAMEFADSMEFMEDHQDLQAACDLIIDNLLPKYRLDIKQDNFMMRGGTIVITDPVTKE